MRSGAQTLVLLSAHRNLFILRSLSDGPKRQAELRRDTGFPAQTTLRAYLRGLEDLGAIAKRRRDAFPGSLEYEMERPGRELLSVVGVLERWLAGAPGGALALGSDAAKAAIKALAEGWSAKMLRVLAGGPLALTELDRVIVDFNYPSLERRLAALRDVGMVKAQPVNGRGVPYGVTAWLRRATGPLAAAARWERRNAPDRTATIRSVDAEAWLLLTLPLLDLPGELSGSCRLAVEIAAGDKRTFAGAIAEVQAGRVRGCTSRIKGHADAWASGSATAWLEAIVDGDPDCLEVGGECLLARAILDGLRGLLFGEIADRPRSMSK